MNGCSKRECIESAKQTGYWDLSVIKAKQFLPHHHGVAEVLVGKGIKGWGQLKVRCMSHELATHQQFVDWLSRQKPYQNALKQYNQQIDQKARKW